MGSEIPPLPPTGEQPAPQFQSEPVFRTPEPVDDPYRRLSWVFIGDQGLRAGWSLALFISLFFLLGNGVRYALHWAHVKLPSRSGPLTPKVAFVGELVQLVLLLLVVWIVSRIERRKLMDYNLRGPRPLAYFGVGLITGFLAISVLVGALSAGGWMHFGPLALSGSQILYYAAAWGVTFLLVGCMEEGLARCYLLFTLARGLNFWWGLGVVTCICLLVSLNPKANGLWGAYAIALLGLVPCLLLHLRKAPGAGFWNAAWVTSVMFGGGHTSNSGENWVGIFAAAGIGLVFCASVRLTGSAWWAIGCHAAWDWGESYFYGTPDSGLVAQGHLLTTTQAGGALWTGGADGPEGSLLVIPIVLLLLLVLVVQYRPKRNPAVPAPSEQPVAG
jgi:uncharacterized protein